MFPRSVSTTRRVHARVHRLKDGCLHTFWLTKTCLCVTFNIWHHVCHIISHTCSRINVPYHDFVTYEPFSLYNFWLTRMSLCANCHIGKRVCVQLVTQFPMFYLDHHVSAQCVDYETCSCVCSRTKKDVCLHTFRIRKTWVCVTFNTWHNVSPNVPMFYDNRRVSTRIFRLYVMLMHKLTQ